MCVKACVRFKVGAIRWGQGKRHYCAFVKSPTVLKQSKKIDRHVHWVTIGALESSFHSSQCIHDLNQQTKTVYLFARNGVAFGFNILTLKCLAI